MNQFEPGTAKLIGLQMIKASAEPVLTRKGLSYVPLAVTTKALNSATGEIEAIANRTGIVDLQSEQMEVGCFQKILGKMRAGKEPWPTLLWSHNWEIPVGVVDYAEERNDGLYIKGRLNLSTSRGKDAYEDLKFGTIKELSIGYMAADGGSRYAMRNGKSVNCVTEVGTLPEISFVLKGASPHTGVLSVKAGESRTLGEDALFQLEARLEDEVNRRLVFWDEVARQRNAALQPKANPRQEAINAIWLRVAAK